MQSFTSTDMAGSQPGFLNRLFRPVDNSPLIIFRIIFGFLLCWHVLSALLNGTVYNNFIAPPFTFTYIGFEFLQPVPGNGMYIYFGVMALLAILIILGAWYRFAMTAFTFLWGVIYLMQKSDYNNHYYLILLLCFGMIFMPANRYFSLDVKRKAVTETISCPQWVTWAFIVQLAIVYFFAALAKISSDWFTGKYIAIQFSRLSTHHILGLVYGQKWFQLFICYGGFLFDLLMVPLLLWKRTRNFMFIVSCFFHLFNSFTFRIGIFPYLSIALNLFFLDAEQIRHFFFRSKQVFLNTGNAFIVDPRKRKVILYCLGIYFGFQLLMPMRSWLFPGNVFWSEEGYRMSWKMMMRTKSGKIHFKVIDPRSQKIWIIEPEKIFSPTHVMWLAICPDISWQYAQRIKKDYAQKGYPNVEIYALGKVSLNRGVPTPLIDTSVNLASVKWQPFRHSDWILPYKKDP